MPPGCQVRLLSDSTWRVSAGGVFFSSASLLSLGCDGVLQDARCRWWRGGRICLGLIVLPLCNQERLIWGDGRFPDPIINN